MDCARKFNFVHVFLSNHKQNKTMDLLKQAEIFEKPK